MYHTEPWFSCDQCGRVLHLEHTALKKKQHFCDTECRNLHAHIKRLKRIHTNFKASKK